MTIDELKKILQMADEKKIRRALEAKGFTECENIPELKTANVAAILRTANSEETEFEDRKRFVYFGAILRNALFYEDYTFIWCEVLKFTKKKRAYLPYLLFFCAKRNSSCESEGEKRK